MILIIDNGSQYTHLIKRNCRELGFEAEMLYAKADYEQVEECLKTGVARIILSGGPSSVYTDPPNLSSMICQKVKDGQIKIPLLGVCYGHQMIAHVWGAKVAKGKSAEYGMGEVEIDSSEVIFKGIPKKLRVWVSHFDEVKELPEDFIKLAHSETCDVEAMMHRTKPIFGIQFHPEVWHSEHGEEIIKNFLEVSEHQK
ncbi:GMP synthase [glutamine-hydrolyzing] subunit A [Candidatus Bilamarchaeum dharawalense]|uniref:GMP synthase [glutamine-hydrolyzing] subunit A n=1 Tax=Candidatus Bilamarchaeum dharawalense TaxID=2885759 RepID=A0A5E4LS37_9ARCH|nr:GMP synthase [glutamine-hydrolyzing] subunit A [Candidatus Bilamarchaeum dharawalense]